MWQSTLRAMDDELVSDSLVYRYDPAASPDGLRGSEGTFTICTFWYVDALARSGRLDDARLTFEKMLTYSNHLGPLLRGDRADRRADRQLPAGVQPPLAHQRGDEPRLPARPRRRARSSRCWPRGARGATWLRSAPARSLRQVLVPLALAQFICSFAGSNMNVMINDISQDLDTTVQGVQIAITIFLLVMAALMIPGGKLTDRYGRKRCFIARPHPLRHRRADQRRVAPGSACSSSATRSSRASAPRC